MLSMSLLLCGSHTCNTDSWLHNVTSRRPHFTALLLILQLLVSTLLPQRSLAFGQDDINVLVRTQNSTSTYSQNFDQLYISAITTTHCLKQKKFLWWSLWAVVANGYQVKQEEGRVENTSGRSSQGAFRRLPFSASMMPKTVPITPCQVSAVFCMCLGLSRDVRSKPHGFVYDALWPLDFNITLSSHSP